METKTRNNFIGEIKELCDIFRYLYNRFKERAGVEIENKDEAARSELEKAYLPLLSDLHVAVNQLAEKYPR